MTLMLNFVAARLPAAMLALSLIGDYTERAQVRQHVAEPAPVPIVFVHGNGDHAGLWDNTIWRFESNGYPRDRLFAVDLPNPVASSTTTARETNRSTPDDQAAALAAFVTRVLIRTGASKVALVGSSRGGLTIRHYLRFGGGAAHVSHVITCGTPNHGVMASASLQPENEFNGLSPYLRALNAGSEVLPGVRFLALRSDSLDKYAQPTGTALGAPGMQTGVDALSPALKGATNIVLPGTDHREVAFGPDAFAAQYRFLTGRAPRTLAIEPESVIVLDGLVSGTVAGAPTNLPLAGAEVLVHETDTATGNRVAEAVHRKTTRSDGQWGPFRARAGVVYEFEVIAPDSSVLLHLYRAPFPRSSQVVNLRLPAPPARRVGAGPSGADSVAVQLVRPRGYLGVGRDTLRVDGELVRGIAPGVPTVDRSLRWFDASAPRSVHAEFNGQRLVLRTQPGDRRRVVVAEFQQD